MKGFKKAIVKCPSGGNAFKYLWTDIRKFQKNPYRFYVYLGVPPEKEEYEKDQKALDGIFQAILACLKNKYSYSRQGRTSKVSRVFAKIKHGFPIYNDRLSDDIFIYLKKNNQIKRQLLCYSDVEAEKINGSLEAMRDTMENFCHLSHKGIKS